jgi:hypothetical protein
VNTNEKLIQLLTFILTLNFQHPPTNKCRCGYASKSILGPATACALRTPAAATTTAKHTTADPKVPKCATWPSGRRRRTFAWTSDWATSSFVK